MYCINVERVIQQTHNAREDVFKQKPKNMKLNLLHNIQLYIKYINVMLSDVKS